MTNEEVERAIDFVLRSQANSEARIEQTNQQLNRLTEGLDELRVQMGAHADTQVELMRVMTMYMESATARQARLEQAHVRLEESQVRINESLGASLGELANRQTKTEEALLRLADAQAQSERSLDRLTRIVEEERGRR